MIPTRTRTRKSTRVVASVDELPRVAGANSTADRALDVLLIFTLDRPAWTTQEIAEHFDMPRTTTLRYISSLKTRSLIVEDSAGRWQLGPMIFPLARAAKTAHSIVACAAPFLQELNDAFGEAVTLYERSGLDSIPLERLETHHRVKLLFSRGHILPWPGAASAKVLLAFAPERIQQELFRQMVPTRYTSHTLATVNALRSSLEKIKKQKYWYSDQEREEGIRAIAAPVFAGSDGRYCVTMSGPSFRMTDNRIPTMVKQVCDISGRITHALSETNF